MNNQLFKCQQCGTFFEPDEEDWDEYGPIPPQTKLCYYCFEDAVEEAHFKRLERIARDNEY